MSSFFRSCKHCFAGKSFLLACILFFPLFVHAQGTWVWEHGSSTPNAAATYGTMFIPSPANNPPGMYKPMGWTDLAGNFWVFGGYNSQMFQCYSDLWKFDPVLNQWTWMGGTGVFNSAGVYGTQGVAAPTNRPGARFRGFSWTDNSGNLWLYGGYGIDVNGMAGKLGDLWKFDVVTGEWTWVKGPNTINAPSSYGTLQVPAASNEPGARDECAVAWKSTSGDLWLFGGQSTAGYLDDVWKYNIASNTWTWMKGQNTINNPPIYGVLNVPNAGNTPGSRSSYARWRDSNGDFWMFGGNVNANLYNDIWKFDPVTLQWTWKGGVAFGNGAANYGPSCEANNYAPSSRTETLCTWNDSCDRFWFMGGNNSNLLNQAVSDVWFFDPSINQYTLVCGTAAINQVGNYGTQQVASPSNYPTSNCGSLGFTDNSGNFWLFCGLLDPSGNNTNAMWKYTRPQYCPHVIFSITGSPLSGCAPLSVTFTLAPGGTNFTYNWDFGDPSTLTDVSNAVNPSYTYQSPGTYTVSLIVHSTITCNPFTDTVTSVITVSAPPQVSLGNDTTLCGAFSLTLDAGVSGSTYAWNTGDTLQSISVTAPGTYSVTVDPNGCPGSDSIVVSNFTAPQLGPDTVLCQGQSLTLYPGSWDSYQWSTGSTNQSVSVNSSGTYWVQVSAPPCVFSDTLNLAVFPLPVVNLGPDTVLCPGGSITLDAGNPGATYAWSTGDTTQSIFVNTSNYYNVVVTENNCSAVSDVQVNYFPNIDLGPGLAFCNQESMDITAGPPGYNYLWNTGDTSGTITIYTAGNYTVQIDNGNCLLRDSIDVSGAPGEGLLFVPNAFTPNGNGRNDVFKAYGDGITYFHMLIFDRWGQLMYETEDLNSGWDGDPHGKRTVSDVFVYKITYRTECSGEQDIEKIGHFTLVH